MTPVPRRFAFTAALVAGLALVAWALLRVADTDPATMRAKYGGPPSVMLSLADGRAVHLRDEGPRDAPVLMLLHGSNANIHTWQPWTEALVVKCLEQSVGNQTVVTPGAIDRYRELARYPGNRAATRLRFAAPREMFAAGAMRSVTVPTLVMWGREDRLLPVAGARWFERMLPNTRVVVYDGIGHLSMEEAAARSAADLRADLATLPSGSFQTKPGLRPVG